MFNFPNNNMGNISNVINSLMGNINNVINSLGGATQMMQQFNQFKNNLQGDPRLQVQNLLNSGQMNQNQYSQLLSLAQTLNQMMPRYF